MPRHHLHGTVGKFNVMINKFVGHLLFKFQFAICNPLLGVIAHSVQLDETTYEHSLLQAWVRGVFEDRLYFSIEVSNDLVHSCGIYFGKVVIADLALDNILKCLVNEDCATNIS